MCLVFCTSIQFSNTAVTIRNESKQIFEYLMYFFSLYVMWQTFCSCSLAHILASIFSTALQLFQQQFFLKFQHRPALQWHFKYKLFPFKFIETECVNILSCFILVISIHESKSILKLLGFIWYWSSMVYIVYITVYIVYSIWFIWLNSNGFMVFLAYPLWFIWLTSNGLYGLFPMVYGSILMV